MLYTTPLSDVAGTQLEELVVQTIDKFSCQDKDVEDFLKQKAFEFEKRDKSRTYLIFDSELSLDGIARVVAYFTLSLKSLKLQDMLSKNKIKDIDGFSRDVQSVAIALIGQFGKDEFIAKNISGKELLDICMKIMYQIHTLIGGRYVLIECQDIDKVVDFYRENGFKTLQTDNNDNYLQMVRRL
ncbi:MAG: hypothetical protein LBJ84_04000 [Oscillospiraceae bacterium]|jgi:hypothetical protein|nr:hypothetical protein [Oscillospiraceae bacterium]